MSRIALQPNLGKLNSTDALPIDRPGSITANSTTVGDLREELVGNHVSIDPSEYGIGATIVATFATRAELDAFVEAENILNGWYRITRDEASGNERTYNNYLNGVGDWRFSNIRNEITAPPYMVGTYKESTLFLRGRNGEYGRTYGFLELPQYNSENGTANTIWGTLPENYKVTIFNPSMEFFIACDRYRGVNTRFVGVPEWKTPAGNNIDGFKFPDRSITAFSLCRDWVYTRDGEVTTERDQLNWLIDVPALHQSTFWSGDGWGNDATLEDDGHFHRYTLSATEYTKVASIKDWYFGGYEPSTNNPMAPNASFFLQSTGDVYQCWGDGVTVTYWGWVGKLEQPAPLLNTFQKLCAMPAEQTYDFVRNTDGAITSYKELKDGIIRTISIDYNTDGTVNTISKYGYITYYYYDGDGLFTGETTVVD